MPMSGYAKQRFVPTDKSQSAEKVSGLCQCTERQLSVAGRSRFAA